MNTKIVIGCDKKKIKRYRRLCEKREYDADVQILEMGTNMVQNQAYKDADIILLSIEKICDYIRYILYCNQTDNPKVILMVNNKIPLMKYLRRILKCKRIYLNDHQITVIENILDIIAYKKRLQITHTDFLNTCSLMEIRSEYCEGTKEMLLVKAALDWNKNTLEKCCLIYVKGNFELSLASEIFELIHLTDDVRFDCNYREHEPIGVFTLWVKN